MASTGFVGRWIGEGCAFLRPPTSEGGVAPPAREEVVAGAGRTAEARSTSLVAAMTYSWTTLKNMSAICACPVGFGWMHVRSNQSSASGPRKQRPAGSS